MRRRERGEGREEREARRRREESEGGEGSIPVVVKVVTQSLTREGKKP